MTVNQTVEKKNQYNLYDRGHQSDISNQKRTELSSSTTSTPGCSMALSKPL